MHSAGVELLDVRLLGAKVPYSYGPSGDEALPPTM